MTSDQRTPGGPFEERDMIYNRVGIRPLTPKGFVAIYGMTVDEMVTQFEASAAHHKAPGQPAPGMSMPGQPAPGMPLASRIMIGTDPTDICLNIPWYACAEHGGECRWFTVGVPQELAIVCIRQNFAGEGAAAETADPENSTYELLIWNYGALFGISDLNLYGMGGHGGWGVPGQAGFPNFDSRRTRGGAGGLGRYSVYEFLLYYTRRGGR